MGIDEFINAKFEPLSTAAFSILFYSVPVAGVDVKLLIVWLALAAVFFTLYLGFVNLRYFRHAIDIVRGKYDRESDDGCINSFQALATSMSGTVGLGNIAGVAVAVSVGGPGAVFWMIVMGFLAMSTKFVEVTAGVKYRRHASAEHPDKISGGPMYYLQDAFTARGLPVLGKFFAMMFAIFLVGGAIGGGNMFQANQAYQQLLQVTGGEAGFLAGNGWAFGIFLAFLTGIVIIGGIKSIANVSSRLVPAMAAIYLTAGIVVIAMNYHNIPAGFAAIIHDALSLEAGIGGILGGMMVGVQRAAFSNEAGIGSAAIVYSATRAHNPVTQGMASMLGPFIDTVIICTITALVIVMSGAYLEKDGLEGVELTSRAMAASIPWFPYVLVLTVFLFAYSTLIAWFYNGLKAVTYLFGERDWIENVYKIFYCLFIVVGASTTLGNVIDFMDALFLSAAIPNIVGLYVLAPEIKRDLKAYIADLKSGREKPVSAT